MMGNNVFPRSIRYLLAVAEHKSFTRASEALYVSQPTLSQQIKQLEDSLNVQLLDRSGRSICLTSAGEVYIHHARRALGEFESASRAIHDLQDLSRGFLRLGMTPITDYLMVPLLVNFSETYPGIRLSMLEMPQSDMKEALEENLVDIGIAFSSTLTMDVCANLASCNTLFAENLGIVFGEDSDLSGQPAPFAKHILEKEPLVLFTRDYALRRHIDHYCQEHGIQPNIAIETSSLSVIQEIVRRGKHITILPETIALQQYGLSSASLLPELPHHTITMVCSKDRNNSPACMAFRNLAQEFFDKKSLRSEANACN